jgi:hypothetical protein
MSIATDEALRHVGYDGIPGPIVAWEDRDLASAYIAGRTAKPTEAEIKAAGYAMFLEDECKRVDTGIRLSPQVWDDVESKYVGYARIALEAAREAVTA